MKTEFVSTLLQHETSRATIARTQSRLERAELEVASGRHADIGTALGFGVSRLLDTRQLAGELDAIVSTNAIVTTRLTQTQAALSGMIEIGQAFFETAVAMRQGGGDRATLVAEAKAALGSLGALLSTTSQGAYVFSGVNTAETPVADYLADPPGPGRLAVQSAFAGFFGFGADDPSVATIDAAGMSAYLDGDFAALFTDAGWQADFSSASDQVLRDRIAPGETIDSSVSANADGVRSLMAVLIATVDSGTQDLSAGAFDRFAEYLGKGASQAVSSLLRTQSSLGVTQERLAKASQRITIERAVLEKQIGASEGVDSYAAAVKLMTLSTQLEASYSVTARMQKMSLLNYL